MKWNSWEADSRSSVQEYPFLSRELKNYYRIHKNQLLDPSHLSPLHILTLSSCSFPSMLQPTTDIKYL